MTEKEKLIIQSTTESSVQESTLIQFNLACLVGSYEVKLCLN